MIRKQKKRQKERILKRKKRRKKLTLKKDKERNGTKKTNKRKN